MASGQWTIDDIPNQRGNVALITGGNSGIGYEAARVLAGKGAHVILAVRNAVKGQAAAAAIQRAQSISISTYSVVFRISRLLKNISQCSMLNVPANSTRRMTWRRRRARLCQRMWN